MSGPNISDLVNAGNAEIQRSANAQAMADAIVTRRLWTACAKTLPELQIRLASVVGSGCEAGAQRSYLRGQFDLLTRELWVALQLPVPPEFATITASTEGRGETMNGEPEEPTTDDAAETVTAEDGGAAAAADDTAAADE